MTVLIFCVNLNKNPGTETRRLCCVKLDKMCARNETQENRLQSTKTKVFVKLTAEIDF